MRTHSLQGAWFQPWNVSSEKLCVLFYGKNSKDFRCEKLVSKIWSQTQLGLLQLAISAFGVLPVGLCKLNPVEP
jgi:hypothetical protein